MSEIVIIGNLTADPERRTANGASLLTFTVAENKRQRQDDGSYKDISTLFYRVDIWGSLAEFYADKLAKGYRVKVIGEFNAREFTRQDGSTGTSLEINKAWGVRVISKPKNATGNGHASAPASTGAYGVPQSATQQPAPQGGGWNPPASDPWSTGGSTTPTNDPWTAEANENGGWN